MMVGQSRVGTRGRIESAPTREDQEKENHRQRSGRSLQWIDAWRASGMKLKDWCELRGEELGLRRFRIRLGT